MTILPLSSAHESESTKNGIAASDIVTPTSLDGTVLPAGPAFRRRPRACKRCCVSTRSERRGERRAATGAQNACIGTVLIAGPCVSTALHCSTYASLESSGVYSSTQLGNGVKATEHSFCYPLWNLKYSDTVGKCTKMKHTPINLYFFLYTACLLHHWRNTRLGAEKNKAFIAAWDQ